MASHLDLPYGKLGNIRDKVPLNFCVLKLPNGASDDAEPTTSFDEARKGKWGGLSRSGPVPLRMLNTHPPMKDASFAKWSVAALPQRCTFADALHTIARSNAEETRVLKYKIKFRDASELTFQRSDPDQPSTLAFAGFYTPVTTNAPGVVKRPRDPSPLADPKTRFLVSANGHTLHGKNTRQGTTHLPSIGKGNSSTAGKGRQMALHFPNSEERAQLFRTLDPNGNGRLSLAELDRGVVMLWPDFNHKPAIMRAYKAADTNGSGLLGRSEFKTFLKYLHYYNELWTRFAGMDADRDRRVTLQELKAGARQLQIPEDQLASAFRAMDTNNGGYVLFDEFAIYMAKQRFGGGLGLSALDRGAAGNGVSYEAHRGRLSSAGSLSTVSSSCFRQAVEPLQMPGGDDLEKLFNDLDPNGNGVLSLAELDKACVYLWPQFNHKPAIMRAYKAADKSRNGWIGRAEFKSFLKYLVKYTELWNVFKTIDRSHDRRISLEELEAAAPHIKGLSKVDVVQAFKKMDRNGGGYVLFEEFCNYLTALQHRAAGN